MQFGHASKTKGGILLPFCVGGCIYLFIFTCVFNNSDYSTIFYAAFSSSVLESSWPPGPMFFFIIYSQDKHIFPDLLEVWLLGALHY